MLICPTCGQQYEPTTDVEHYEDTGYICDECLARKLGIVAEGETLQQQYEREYADGMTELTFAGWLVVQRVNPF